MFGVIDYLCAFAVVALSASVLILGVVGPAWKGTKSNRSIFWVVFFPALLFLLAVVFLVGRIFG